MMKHFIGTEAFHAGLAVCVDITCFKYARGRNNVRSSDMTDHIYHDWSEYIASEMLSSHFTNDKFL